MALGTGWDGEGRSLYRLIVHGAEVPGRCVVDREFVPARRRPPGCLNSTNYLGRP
jgi:hypothetical protein